MMVLVHAYVFVAAAAGQTHFGVGDGSILA